jgi:hypothetical protein
MLDSDIPFARVITAVTIVRQQLEDRLIDFEFPIMDRDTNKG